MSVNTSIISDYMNLTSTTGNTLGNEGGVASVAYEGNELLFTETDGDVIRMDAANLTADEVKALADELGETVHMGILQDDMAVYVLKEESIYTLRMYSQVGKAIPLYCTGIGKIFLSEMSGNELSSYLDTHQLKPFTPKSIKTEEDMRKELIAIKERGWAMDDEEHEMNIKCIAAPVKDYTGKTVAAISASWPIFRFNEEHKEDLAAKVTNVTKELSGILGYEG